jgi:hypothetical protein
MVDDFIICGWELPTRVRKIPVVQSLTRMCHTFEVPQIVHPTSFRMSSGRPASNRIRRRSTSLDIDFSSSFSRIPAISSRRGRELYIADCATNVVVAVGCVGSGEGRVESKGYTDDPGNKSSRAATIWKRLNEFYPFPLYAVSQESLSHL